MFSIGQFELGKTLYHDHKVRQMFMLFEFMPKFHRDDEQQTMRVKKESQFVDFGYTKAFPVKDSGLRAALAALLECGRRALGQRPSSFGPHAAPPTARRPHGVFVRPHLQHIQTVRTR